MADYVPLPHEWMLFSIIGFFVTVFMIFDFSRSWGFAFAIFFIIIFIASIVNMSNSGTEDDHLVELAVHHERVRAGEHRRRAR
jgi:hypothetical protein